MPNWCMNEIVVDASAETINKILDEVCTNKVLDFIKVDSTYRVGGGGQLMVEGNTHLSWEIESPWSPPKEVYKILKNKYPDANWFWFYREDSNAICGYLHVEMEGEQDGN